MGFLDKNPGGYIGYDAEYDLGGVYSVKDATTGIVRNNLQFYLDAANKNTYAPYQVRYIRWSANGGTTNASTHFVELQAWGTNGTNKASGISFSVIQGTPEGSGTTATVTNGNTATTDYFGMGGTQPTIQIDLGNIYDIQSFNLWMYYGDGRSYYSVTLQVSTDAINFYNILDPVTLAVNNTRITATTYNDISGLNENVTVGTISYTKDNKGAFIFEGTSANRLFRSTSTVHRSAGQELTVCAMVYIQALGGAYRDIIVNRSDSLYNWMLYQHTTDGSIQLHGAAQNKSSYIPTINQWVYLCATVDASGNYKMYANGSIVQTLTGFAYQTHTPNYLVIGAFGGGIEPWLGKGSVYQIYNRALSKNEVLRNFDVLRGRYGI
jgi:hypothetical protein